MILLGADGCEYSDIGIISFINGSDRERSYTYYKVLEAEKQEENAKNIYIYIYKIGTMHKSWAYREGKIEGKFG